jgi:ribose transport system substrate-binding protein
VKLGSISLGLAFLAASALTLGCGRNHAPQRISAIMSHFEMNSLCERAGLDEAASTANLEIYWNGPSNWDVQRQIDLIESSARARSYGIAVNPVSPFAVNTAIREALSNRIPVVILVSPVRVAPSAHLYFVLEDTKASAVLVSRRLNHLLNGQGEVALLGLDPLHPGSIERFEDVEAVLHRDSPSIHVDDQTPGPFGYGDLELGAEQILREHPHIDAIVALNAGSGEAAVAAIRAANLQKKVYVIVYDQSLQLFLLLRHGKIDSIIAQNMRGIGARAVADIVADRTGKYASETTYLQPKLITLANIDEESNQQFLIMRWQPQ